MRKNQNKEYNNTKNKGVTLQNQINKKIVLKFIYINKNKTPFLNKLKIYYTNTKPTINKFNNCLTYLRIQQKCNSFSSSNKTKI